MIVPDLLIFD